MINEKIQYIRTKDRQKIGVLIACQIDGKIRFGWSLCCKKDKFDKYRGIEIAYGRASRTCYLTIPPSIMYSFINFISRCKRYYKDKEIATSYFIKRFDTPNEK